MLPLRLANATCSDCVNAKRTMTFADEGSKDYQQAKFYKCMIIVMDAVKLSEAISRRGKNVILKGILI